MDYLRTWLFFHVIYVPFCVFVHVLSAIQDPIPLSDNDKLDAFYRRRAPACPYSSFLQHFLIAQMIFSLYSLLSPSQLTP